MSDVTRILSDIERGRPRAAEELLPLVYRELRRLAARNMASERSDHTMQATALVHEAYIRLVDVETPQDWKGRGHFFAAAAEAMRRILIDSARRRSALKRGSELKRIPLDEIEVGGTDSADKVLAVDAALSRLTKHDPIKAKLVELRYFGGLTIDEAAEAMGISAATANRHWAYARAWLQAEMISATDSSAG
jgi:RNA polymerase sigma factor (TIGR02999 family)